MCGIVGYLGHQQAYPILIQGLKRLEYRGYDSAGIALVHDNGELEVFKAKGKVANLEHLAQGKDLSGTIGIAHTRWATHGEPNDINAHPHYSQSKTLALIHNGIIENYVVLRETLKGHGYTFQSDTDTEVLVQLIEFIKQTNHCDLCTAVQLALHEVVGAYAIAIVEKDNPDLIVSARKSSPLVIGIKGDERFLASDAAPIIEHTKEVVYLNDEEIVLFVPCSVIGRITSFPYRLRDIIRNHIERILRLLARDGQLPAVLLHTQFPGRLPAPDIDIDPIAARLLTEITAFGIVFQKFGQIFRRGIVTGHFVHVAGTELLVAVLDAAVGPLHPLAVDREDRVAVGACIGAEHLEMVGSRTPP